jgi:hypothetical protein
LVENYQRKTHDTLMAGADARPMPYPHITSENWRA